MSLSAPHGLTTGNLFVDRAVADLGVIPGLADMATGLKKGQVLDATSHMYFPIDVLISLRFDLRSGFTAEFRQIGREGFLGFSALMGGEVAASAAVAQTAGRAYRVPVALIQALFDSSTRFRTLTLAYMQALMQEAAQSIVCNRFHAISQQCARCLLLAADRLGSETLGLTHEQLAVAIGCRREAVSLAVQQLEVAGLVVAGYGRITISDREALKMRACECYHVVSAVFSGFDHSDGTAGEG